MNKRSCATAGAFFAFILPLAAQPALAPLKPGVSWKVEQNDGPGGKFRPVEENVMGEGFRKNTVFPSGGAALTRFVVGNLVFYRAPGASVLSIESAGVDAFGGAIERWPRTEFDWIGPRWRAQDAEADGVRCFVYRRPIEDSFETVYVQAETRFPVRLERPPLVRKYQFSVNPPSELPSDIREALKKREQVIAREKQIYRVPQ